jgi:hypothetical protein
MAYKVLNYLIYSKVGFKIIKLFINKLNILTKLLNSVKYRLRYYIRFKL